MKYFCLLMILGVTVSLRAQDVFTLPDNLNGTAVGHLEDMKIRDPSRRLSVEEKRALCRLFVKAYALSIRRHKQDYLLNTSAPVYRLLVTNFPEIRAKEGEGGSVIFLGAITRFFNKSPEYRPDVMRVLKAGLSSRYCNQL